MTTMQTGQDENVSIAVNKITFNKLKINIFFFKINLSLVNTSSQTGYNESMIYVKKLIVIGLSTIAYLRAILPKEEFLDRYLEGLKVKIINGKSIKCVNAQTFNEWINGAFEALEKKYVSLLPIICNIYI